MHLYWAHSVHCWIEAKDLNIYTIILLLFLL